MSAATVTKSEHARPGTYQAKAYGAQSAKSGLAGISIPRRDPGPRDVKIEILYCGVCHSDLHQVRNEWENAMPTVYPCVPGHEIVGRIVETGSAVAKFKEGDIGAVGCMVGSCGECTSCVEGLEQFCVHFPVLTYNSPDKVLGGVTYGGYSESIVVDEAFVLRVPNGLDPAGAAPMLCAGITTYSPLRHWNLKKGQTLGVVGLGGLGHMALKFGKAMGANVLLFTTSAGKTQDAVRLGADEVVISKNQGDMQKRAGSCDLIIDAVSADHDIAMYLQLLKRDGTLVLVGAPPSPLAVPAFGLLVGRRQLAGSIIGGIRETQEMLDFAGDRGITAEIEKISMGQINEAYERLLKSDVKYRFVIDMATL